MDNKKFSKELQPIFSYMVDILGTEFPTKMFTVDYLLLSLLECKKNNAYIMLNSFLTSYALEELNTHQMDNGFSMSKVTDCC